MARWVQQHPPPRVQLRVSSPGPERDGTMRGFVHPLTGRKVQMNDRGARPHRGAVIHHQLQHQQDPWHLHAGAGRGAPQQTPTQQLEVEVRQPCRVSAVQGHPDEAQVASAGRLGHPGNGSRAGSAYAPSEDGQPPVRCRGEPGVNLETGDAGVDKRVVSMDLPRNETVATSR
jgi:hypothetical protein